MSLYNQNGGEGYIQFVDKIGKGSFGIVFRVKCKQERETKPCSSYIGRYIGRHPFFKCYKPDYSDFFNRL